MLSKELGWLLELLVSKSARWVLKLGERVSGLTLRVPVKYAIVRLPDQPNIPIQEGREEEARAIFEACGKGPNPDEEDEVEGEEEDVEQEQKEDAVGEIVDVAKEDGKGEVEDVVPASGSSSSGSVDGVGSDDGMGEKETPATSPAEEVEDERKG